MVSNALWKVFEATGHIGAYLLYKDYQELDQACALKVKETVERQATAGK